MKKLVNSIFPSCSSKNTVTRATYYKKSSATSWTNANKSFSSGTAFTFGGGAISTESSYDVKYTIKLVLKPYATALQNNSGDESLVRIQHLERLLEQNTKQRETLTRLMAQGYIDQVLYNSETNALLMQANTYREDIEVINATMSGDSSRFFEAERLLHFAERGSMLEEYSEDLFERFVDHIQVYSRHEVGFVMKCGLTFKEMI